MLKVSKPTQLAEGVTMSPARMMLEILAIYETFGMFPSRVEAPKETGTDPFRLSDSWRRTHTDQ
jgi:hypothetical protein